MSTSLGKKSIILLLSLLFIPLTVFGQTQGQNNLILRQYLGIGTTGAPAASSALQIDSTTKGFVPPRMTEAQRDAMNSPLPGNLLFNTDTGQLNIWDGDSWELIGGGIPPMTADRVVITDGSGDLSVSTMTPTELLQMQLDISDISTKSLPVGGTTGQVLSKASDGDYDAIWSDPPADAITALTGDVSASGTGSVAATLKPITNAQIAGNAGIGVTKFEALTASRPVVTNASGFLSTPSATLTGALGGTGMDTSASSGVLKYAIGTPSVAQITNADIAAAAGIGVTKLEALTASLPVVTDSNGKLTTSATFPAAVQTDWVIFTPTGSWSANITYAGRWRRVGDSMQIMYSIKASGAPSTGTLTVNLPSGYSIDTAKLASSSTTSGPEQVVGVASLLDAGAKIYVGNVLMSSSTSLVPYVQGSGDNRVDSGGGVPLTMGANDVVTISATVPISGWTAGNVMSASAFNSQFPAPLTATSSTKTPGATNHWHAHSGNSLTLTAGVWRLGGSIQFTGIAAVGYSAIKVKWHSANGADSTTEPAALSSVVTVLSPGNSDFYLEPPTASSNHTINAPYSLVRCTFSCTVYLNTLASMTTASNARITVYPAAEKVADFTVYGINGLNTVISNNSSTGERVERLHFAASSSGTTSCSSSPCTIWSQSGSWATSVIRGGTGQYSVTVPSGTFSATPTCTCSAGDTSQARFCAMIQGASSATSLTVNIYSNNTTTADGYASIICMGPR